MRIIETTTPLDDDPSLKDRDLAMIGGVANGSCELQIVTVNTKCCAATYESQGETDSVSKQLRREVEMLQVCSAAEELL